MSYGLFDDMQVCTLYVYSLRFVVYAVCFYNVIRPVVVTIRKLFDFAYFDWGLVVIIYPVVLGIESCLKLTTQGCFENRHSFCLCWKHGHSRNGFTTNYFHRTQAWSMSSIVTNSLTEHCGLPRFVFKSKTYQTKLTESNLKNQTTQNKSKPNN